MITATNLQTILNGYSYILLMAIGMLFVIIMGQIDLSPGSVAAVVGICVALSIKDWGIPWWLGVILGLGVGIIIGMWQGSWLAFIGVPGFITTLAGQLLFRGLNQQIGSSVTVPVPKEISYIGGGYLPQWGPKWGSATGLNNSTILLGLLAIVAIVILEIRRRGKVIKAGGKPVPVWALTIRLIIFAIVLGVLAWRFASGRAGTSFPMTGIILVVLALVYNFIATRTTIGRGVYAVGGNRAAAALTGVNTKKVYFIVMTNMSFLAAVAAIMFIGRAGSSGPSDGVGWELDAIAAVFIGGAAVSGGVGTVIGSVLGGLVMASLNNGMYLIGVASSTSAMIRGLVLLVAVAIDLYSKSQGRPSIIGTLMRGNARRRKGAEPADATPAQGAAS
jgi:putative multiple sugar transport system permease protein